MIFNEIGEKHGKRGEKNTVENENMKLQKREYARKEMTKAFQMNRIYDIHIQTVD